MGSWHEFQEDSAVDNQVATSARGRESDQRSHANVCVGTSSCYQEDSADQEGAIEGKSTADNVASESPEESTNDQTDNPGQKLDV